MPAGFGASAERCSGASRIRGGELGVLLQDLPLEPPERGAGVDAELVDHHVPCLLVRPESVGLPSRPIQRQHELSTEVLTKWVLRDQALESGTASSYQPY